MPEMDFSCYCIRKDINITDKGFSFRADTFIYGKWVEDYLIDNLLLNYRVEDEDYTDYGKIDDTLYKEIISCLKTSTNLRLKFKKMMESWDV